MNIITYSADPADNAPASSAAVAYIYLGTKGGFLPVVYRAPTRDEARARAQAHWDAEIEKAEARANRPKKGGRPKKTEAPSELPDDGGEAI